MIKVVPQIHFFAKRFLVCIQIFLFKVYGKNKIESKISSDNRKTLGISKNFQVIDLFLFYQIFVFFPVFFCNLKTFMCYKFIYLNENVFQKKKKITMFFLFFFFVQVEMFSGLDVIL